MSSQTPKSRAGSPEERAAQAAALMDRDGLSLASLSDAAAVHAHIARAIRAAVAAEREACMKDMCHGCRAGWAVECDEGDDSYWHVIPADTYGRNRETVGPCHAAAIRRRGEIS